MTGNEPGSAAGYISNTAALPGNEREAARDDAIAVKNILDPSFRYVPSHATDVRKTFERILRERQAAQALVERTVVPLNRERRSA